MNQFIELCNEGVNALAKNSNSNLNMAHWVNNVDGEHPCKTAACVCGFIAIERVNGPQLFTPKQLSEIACRISDDLEISACKLFGDDDLALAIYSYSSERRLAAAVRTGLFSNDELKHPHLNKNNPSIDDAISFLKLCIKKAEAVPA